MVQRQARAVEREERHHKSAKQCGCGPGVFFGCAHGVEDRNLRAVPALREHVAQPRGIIGKQAVVWMPAITRIGWEYDKPVYTKARLPVSQVLHPEQAKVRGHFQTKVRTGLGACRRCARKN